LLQNDSEDLIHKAVGWMLREAGKKDQAKLMAFLSDRAHQMPKTMYRYATERLSKEQRAPCF
jgi:3-methyladenine DNA glycosylase AlkD